jgi:hypothetical protein
MFYRHKKKKTCNFAVKSLKEQVIAKLGVDIFPHEKYMHEYERLVRHFARIVQETRCIV